MEIDQQSWRRRWKERRTSTMPENMVSYDDLPRDLMKSILTKLSPRDLLISMSVCKTWRAIIRDDSSFRHMHLKHSRRASIFGDRKAGLVIVSTGDSAPASICMRHSLDFHRHRSVTFDGTSYDAVTSCDGLVLLSTRLWKPRLMLLWNPVIRKIRGVPSSGVTDVLRRDLIRPPRMFVGFGCIEYNNKYCNDYKIVEVHYINCLNNGDENNTHVMVYSLSSDSWRRIGAIPPSYARNLQEYGVFVNDSVHWPAKSKEGSRVIMGFDLREEVFWEVPPPADYHNNYHDIVWILTIFEGLLSTVVTRRDNEVGLTVVEIWVMKEHRVAASWYKHRVVGPRRHSKVLGCSKDRKVLPEGRFEEVVECHPGINEEQILLPDAMRAQGLTTYLESVALLDDDRTRFIQLN